VLFPDPDVTTIPAYLLTTCNHLISNQTLRNQTSQSHKEIKIPHINYISPPENAPLNTNRRISRSALQQSLKHKTRGHTTLPTSTITIQHVQSRTQCQPTSVPSSLVPHDPTLPPKLQSPLLPQQTRFRRLGNKMRFLSFLLRLAHRCRRVRASG
jgi:hypothetical protein